MKNDRHKETARKRGRKRIDESRAVEIRARLVEWKQIPEPARMSLRALAAEIGTSHQLLSFYLQGLNRWQAEQAQALAYDRAGYSTLDKCYRLEVVRLGQTEVRRGKKLAPWLLSIMRNLAQQGVLSAQEVVTLNENLPRPAQRKRLDAVQHVIDELEWVTDSDKALRLINRLTPEERKEFFVLQEKRRRARQGDRT